MVGVLSFAFSNEMNDIDTITTTISRPNINNKPNIKIRLIDYYKPVLHTNRRIKRKENKWL